MNRRKNRGMINRVISAVLIAAVFLQCIAGTGISIKAASMSEWEAYGTPWNYLVSAAYGNGVFLVLDGEGRMFSSQDGSQWEECGKLEGHEEEDNGTYGFYDMSMSFCHDRFYLTGEDGIFLYSTDGTEWEEAVCDAEKVFQIGYMQGTYYALSGKKVYISGGIFRMENSRIYTSGNGREWTVQESTDENMGYVSMAMDENALVLLGITEEGTYAVSLDASGRELCRKLIRTKETPMGGADAVYNAGGCFLAVCGGRCYRSEDGTAWSDCGAASYLENAGSQNLVFCDGEAHLYSGGSVYRCADIAEGTIDWYKETSYVYGSALMAGNGRLLIVDSNSVQVKKLSIHTTEDAFEKEWESGGSSAEVSGNEIPEKLVKDISVSGNCVLEGKNIDLNGYSMTVQGDLIQTQGDICLNGGTLFVSGSYLTEGGLLVMQKPEDMVSVSGSYLNRSAVDARGYMTEGLMRIGGDFTVTEEAGEYAFAVGRNHTVELCGESAQNVSIQKESGESAFANLILSNSSEQGIHFENDPYVRNQVRDNAAHIGGRISVGKHTVFADNHYGGDVVNLETVRYDESLQIGGSYFVRQPMMITGDVTVDGTVCVEKSGIVMQDGSLEAGNLEVTDDTFGISMKHGDDKVVVRGNMTWGETYDYYGNRESRLMQGEMHVAGDVSLGSLFFAEEGHVLVLNGNGRQIIEENGGQIGTLEIQNESREGVWSENILHPKRAVYNGNRLNYGEGNTEGITGFDLKEDRVIDGDVYLMDGAINLNGHTLTIRGNLTQASGTIDINGGTLHVEGNYQMLFTENGGTKSDKTSYGILKMTEPEDYVIVGGDMTVGTSKYLGDSLTDGTLELHGNFSQERYDNFAPRGNHVTYWVGKKDADGNLMEQSSYFQSRSYGIRYNILLLDIDAKGSYRFSGKGSDIAAPFYTELRYTKDKTPPTVVTNLKAQCHTYRQADLSWDAASDNVKVTGYAVYRNGEQIGVTTGTEYADTELAFGDHTYQVYAYDAEGNQASVSPEAGLTIKQDVTPPGRVKGLSVYTRSGSSITLKWKEADDDFAVTGYDLYRNGSLIAENRKEPVYKDSGLEEGKIYEYAVIAKDAEGNISEMSVAVRAEVCMPRITRVFPEDSDRIGGGSAGFEVFYANAGNSTGNRVRIEYYDISTEKWVRVNPKDLGQNVKDSATFVSSFAWQIPDFQTEQEMSFRYTVTDCDGNETSKTVAYFVDRMGPSMPQALAVEENNGVALLKWEKAAADDVEKYRIERRLKGETEFVFLATTASDVCSYQDTRGLIGKTYEYRVWAYDDYWQRGNCTDIAEAAITPDQKAPEVTSLTSLVPVVRGSVPVVAQAVDNRRVLGFKFYVRKSGEEDWKLLGERATETGQASWMWDTAAYADGYYYFKATAYDEAGNESQNPPIHTVTVDNTGISEIVLKEWKNVNTAARLVWEEPSEDDFSHYVLQEKTGAYWYYCATIPKGKTEYLIRNLEAGISHSFRIVGYDKVGNAGIPSEEITFTAVKDTEPPVIESVSPQAGAYPEIAELSMTVRDSGGIDYGRFSYSRDGKNFVKIADVSVETLEEEAEITYRWNTSSLPEGEITVRFQSADMSGFKSADRDMTYLIDRTPPERIDSLCTTAQGDAVLLSWAENGEDVSHYRIYRTEKNGTDSVLLADHVEQTFYRDSTADVSLVYLYQVSAVDFAGNESPLSERIPGGAVEDTEPPSRVVGLFVKTRTGSAITVGWKEAADNYAVKGYNIYRDGILIAQDVKETEYRDTGLSPNTLYTYTVTALDKAGNESEKSEGLDGAVFMPKIVEILPKDYAVLGGTQAELTVRFRDAGNSAGNYVTVEYNHPDTGKWEKITPEPISQKRYNETTLQASCMWTLPQAEEDLYVDVCFTVTDADGNKTEQIVSYEIDRTPPAAPEKLTAEESDGTIVLAWEPSGSADTQEYYIYRKTEEEEKFIRIGSVTGRMSGWYVDGNVTDNTGYTYQVSAYDIYGQEGKPCPQAVAVSGKDNRAPQIEEMTPEAGKVSQITKITVKAHDNRAVAKISLYLKKDGEEQWEELAQVTAENDTGVYEWDTTLFADGSYYIKAVAWDASGNGSEKEFLRHYTIDNTGPAKIVLGECSAAASLIQLIWQDVAEEDFGYFAVEQYTQAAWKEIGRVTNQLGYTVTGLLPETAYTFRVVGYDAFNNRGEASEEITLETVSDEVCPVITRIDPVAGCYNDRIVLSMHVKDNVGVASGIFSYTVDGENYTELATVENPSESNECDFQYTWDILKMPETEVTVRFEAMDTAGLGNSLTSEGKCIENSYIIDHTPPERVEGLAVTGNEGYIGLTWEKMQEQDISHFVILRSDAADGAYTVINQKCETGNYYDTAGEPGRAYYYKVGAVDTAGNQGALSETVSGIVRPDREAPKLLGMSPKENTVLGREAKFTVLATDNAALSEIVLSYREKGALQAWTEIADRETAGREACEEITWDAKGLKEDTVYEVRAVVRDAQGNEGEPLIKEYKLDLTQPKTPVLTAESGSYRIRLEYGMEQEETDIRYEIYRKALWEQEYLCIWSGNDTAYEDTTVETDLFYYYKVRAYDEHGNYAESAPVHNYANPVDTIAPVAKLPENVMAVTGFAMRLDGTASTDNVRIMRYEWNFGDGTKGTGARPNHTYKKAGTYIVSLTVADAAGNSDSTTATVLVLDGDNHGTTTLSVIDEQGCGLGGAVVYVRTGNGEGEYIKTATDANGKVDIATTAGVYEVGVYKEGYLPADGTIRVSNYEILTKQMVLKSGEVVTGEMSVHRMELDELIEQGVDLSNPENYHTYTFRVELTFASAPLPVIYEGSGAGGAVQLSYDSGSVGNGAPFGEGNGGSCQVYAVEYGQGKELERHSYGIYYLSTTQSVRWLKEMYNVELGIVNHADSGFDIVQASATLNLPEGLSLAQTKSGQTLTTNFEDIKGQHSARASWVVRGDAPGEYELCASFHGLLTPFMESIDEVFTAKQQVEVDGGKGICIDVYPEEALYPGGNYYIQFVISNNSGHNIYNLTTTLGDYISPAQSQTVIYKDIETGQVTGYSGKTQGKTFIIPSANECKQIPVMYAGNTINVGVFAPDDTIKGTYKHHIEGTSDESYFVLVDDLVKGLRGVNLGVTVNVHKISSHLSKYIYYRRSHGNGTSDDEEIEVIGDPVDAATGAFTQEINALTVTGATTLSLDLNYNSMMADTKGESGYGFSNTYEQRIEDEGALLELYMTPYSTCSFVNDAANENEVYGYLAGDEIILDDVEYTGHYSPCSEAMKGWEIEKHQNGYTVTDQNTKTVYDFDTKGYLKKITQRDKKSVTLKREEGKTTVRDDISGKKLLLSYNEQKMLESVSDTYDRKAEFAYDSDGNLTSFTDVLGNTSVFTYDKDHHILKIADESGVASVENTYDEEGRVLTQKEAGSSKKTVFSYEDTKDGGVRSVITNRIGATFIYETDERGNIIRQKNPEGGVTESLYDKHDNLLTETAPDGSKVMYEYDDDGRRIALYDTAGNATYITYNSDGDVTRVENERGDTATFCYDADSSMVSATGNNGSTTSYTYDRHGNVTEAVTEGMGSVKYTYEKGMLAAQTDYNGNTTSYEYDKYGNVAKTTGADGKFTEQVYDKAGRLIKSTDRLGTVTEYTYDGKGNRLTETTKERTTSYAYDGAGRLEKLTNAAGDETLFGYDAEGRLLQITYPDKTKSSYSYDKNGNLLTETDPDGTRHEYVYDCMNHVTEENHAGQVTKYEYYPNGKVYQALYPDKQTLTYTYDCNWNVILITDQDDNTTKYEYDALGNVTKITDALGNETTASYDKNGRKLSETDANGNTTSYKYDGNGNCIQKTNAIGLVSCMEYDAYNRLVKVTSKTEKGDISVGYTYDANGRLTNTTDANGNTSTVSYDDYGNAAVFTDALGNVVQTNTYDSIDQLKQSWDALGAVTGYAYNKSGAVTGMTQTEDPEKPEASRITSYSYDEGNRLKEVTDAENGVSSYVYDKAGNIQSVTDPKEGTTIYAYDAMNRPLLEQTDAGGVYGYAYNTQGLLSEVTNAAGKKTSYTYDAIGRVTETKDELGTVKYTYDAVGNLLTVTDKNGKTSRTYDKLNRVKTYTDKNGKTVEYGYDELGNRISLTYPGGEIVRYSYDNNGNLKTVTDAQGGVTTYTYNANNHLTSVTRPDKSTEEYEYNNAGYVTGQTDKTADGKTIHQYHYTYDAYGNITKTTGMDSGDPSLITQAAMTYGKDNRLATYNGETVKYDPEGNMTYGPLNGRMADMTYDCRNRLIQVTEQDGTVTEYEYDAENTRTAVIKDGVKTIYVTDKEATYSQILTETSYTKNALGLCTKKQTEKTYTYGVGLISEHTTGQETTGDKGQGSGQDGTQTLYYHYNNLGSTTKITDKNGNILYRFAYGTYGELTAILDADGENLIIPQDGKTVQQCRNEAATETGVTFLYNGKYGVTTDTNGLYYMRARYYNTDIRRFTNRDTVDGSITNSQSLNKYSYVQGNPVTLTDPFGLNPLGNLYNIDWSGIGHTILDVVGIFCDAADLLNAAWYALEGNYQMAMACGIAAIPLAGSGIAAGLKLAMGAEKAAKAVKIVKSVTKLATFTSAATITAIDTYYAVVDAKASYDAGTLTFGEAAKVAVLGGATAALSIAAGKSAIGTANVLHETNAVRKAINGVTEGITKLHNDNRGVVDLSAFSRNKAKDAMKVMRETPEQLYAFGNRTQPRGARPKQDFGVDNFNDVVGVVTERFPKGASNVTDINSAPLSGHYHTLPKGTKLPIGLAIKADGINVFPDSPHGVGHYTIFPTKEMTVTEFNELYQSLPWNYGGKK